MSKREEPPFVSDDWIKVEAHEAQENYHLYMEPDRVYRLALMAIESGMRNVRYQYEAELSRLRTEQEGKIKATGLKDRNGFMLSIGQRVRLLGVHYREWPPCVVERDDFGTPGFLPEGYPLFVTFDKYFMQEKHERDAFVIIDPPSI